MLIQQQPAYILHTRPWRETSLLLECLTRDQGRVGMVARGARRRGARAAQSDLQPFRELALSFTLRGELATLRVAEPVGRPLVLQGSTLLAGLYINELVVRLSGRQDPDHALYGVYERTVRRFAGEASLSWTLRRFERDLLQALGYGMQLEHEVETGSSLQADVDYVYVPEYGPVRAGVRQGQRVRGADLMALAADREPDPQALGRLRRLMRAVLVFHLGGTPLKSWQVLAGALVRGT